MSHEAVEKGQPEVPVYDVEQLLAQAAAVGVTGIIDCGCELPNLMTAIQMAVDHPDSVHAAIAIHPMKPCSTVTAASPGRTVCR